MGNPERTDDDGLGLDLQAEPTAVTVTSRFPLASGWRPGVASLLDCLCLAGGVVATLPALRAALPADAPWATAAVLAGSLLAGVSIQAAIYLARPGRTVGMLIAGLKLVGEGGAAPSFVRGFLARGALIAVGFVLSKLPIWTVEEDGRPFHDGVTRVWLVRA